MKWNLAIPNLEDNTRNSWNTCIRKNYAWTFFPSKSSHTNLYQHVWTGSCFEYLKRVHQEPLSDINVVTIEARTNVQLIHALWGRSREEFSSLPGGAGVTTWRGRWRLQKEAIASVCKGRTHLVHIPVEEDQRPTAETTANAISIPTCLVWITLSEKLSQVNFVLSGCQSHGAQGR